MFSDMNKVTQKPPNASTPRTTQTDTREEIRHHDPDQERKKGEHKGFAEEQGLFGDDQTEISVQSLESFLPMLLKNYTAKQEAQENNAPTDKVDQTNPNAKAAGAYARMAQYNPPQTVSAKAQEDKEDQNENPTLSNEEVQAIHRLQADIAKLRAKGVSEIYINKADTFLESLQNGVKEAL